jgi:hypothetical protein
VIPVTSLSRLQRGHIDGEPVMRFGICNGDKCREKKRGVQLYLVMRSIYRCAACYKIETGRSP